MFPTEILVAVDGYRETFWAGRAAVEAASGIGSEPHVVHVVPKVAELPYLHLAAREGGEDFLVWRRLEGLEVLDDRVGCMGEDLGSPVTAPYYREGKPDKFSHKLVRKSTAPAKCSGWRSALREQV